jgi:hypothetical protein
MVQDPNDMMFCAHCKMNVFPSRQKFNIKIFGAFIILMVFLFVIIMILSYTLFSQILFFFFFMWGFMLLNPYLIYHGLQKKQYCPRCFKKAGKKNLDYFPFGDKEPEIYKKLAPSKKSHIVWHCPYCGKSLRERSEICNTCGKKVEIIR